MKVTAVETQPLFLPMQKPIGAANDMITGFGCVLVTVRTDDGITGECLLFASNDRRTQVIRPHNVAVASHVFPATSIQVLGGLSNSTWLEYMDCFFKLYTDKLPFEDGCVGVPEQAGWRITFNREYLAHLDRRAA